jgi:hypothetical protein
MFETSERPYEAKYNPIQELTEVKTEIQPPIQDFKHP